MTWISTHGKPTQRAPRSVGMLEHLGSTHPGSMSILSTASLLAVEALLPLCVLKQGLKKRKRKCWGGLVLVAKAGAWRELFYELALKPSCTTSFRENCTVDRWQNVLHARTQVVVLSCIRFVHLSLKSCTMICSHLHSHKATHVWSCLWP